MQKITVFGGGGFIGSKILELSNSYNFDAIRGDWRSIDTNLDYGIVVFCLGVGDCNRPVDMYESHLNLLNKIITKCQYKKIIYISSTRLYLNSTSSHESDDIQLLWNDNRRFFNLLKLTAEEMLKLSGRPFTIVRPSNVYGFAIDSPLFLPSILRDAISKKSIDMYVNESYAKDYVLVDDVANATLSLIANESTGIFNIASGENITAKEISDIIANNTKSEVMWHDNSCEDKYPLINIEKVKKEIGFKPSKLMMNLEHMINNFKAFYKL